VPTEGGNKEYGWLQELAFGSTTYQEPVRDGMGTATVQMGWLSRVHNGMGTATVQVGWLSRVHNGMGTATVQMGWLSRVHNGMGTATVQVGWLSRVHPSVCVKIWIFTCRERAHLMSSGCRLDNLS